MKRVEVGEVWDSKFAPLVPKLRHLPLKMHCHRHPRQASRLRERQRRAFFFFLLIIKIIQTKQNKQSRPLDRSAVPLVLYLYFLPDF